MSNNLYICLKLSDMKQILTFLLLSAFALSISAQSLVVTGDTLITGDPNLQLKSWLTVANISNKTIDVRCRINPISNTGISNPIPAEFSFCWGGVCYGSGTDTSGQLATLTSGQFVVYPDLPAHAGYFDAFGYASTGEIEYCFYDEANPTDETCFTVTFNATTTAIEDKYLSEKISNFYPNPSKDYVSIIYTAKEEYTIAIVDVLGNKLKTITLNQVENQKIFIGDLPNGMYFGRITTDGNLLAIKKLIIKR